jgi:FMN phosphatase YigB (HAD superfamily)
MRLEAIIFDIGNVLLHFDFDRAIRRIAPYCETEDVLILGLLEPLKHAFESGRISNEVFVEEACGLIGYEGDREELAVAWQEIFDPVVETHALVKQLRGKLPLYLLSNTNGLHAEYFLREYPVFENFQGAVYSHEVGMMKPDAEIYRHAVSQFGVNPNRTLFIDDLAANIEGARAEGLLTHHYEASVHAELIQTLAKFGVHLP